MPVGDTVEPYNPDVHKSMWYNPDVHTEIWQNDMPFVLVKYNRRVKICRGCTAKFLPYHTYQVCYTARRADASRQKDEITKCILPLQPYVHEIKAPILQTKRCCDSAKRS